MKTLKEQTLQNMPVQLTLFPEDSRASLSPSQEKEKEQMMTATSGRKCFELYGKFNRNGLLLKMLVESLLKKTDWYSSVCALTWKVKGTRFNRLLFRLVPSMRRTEGKGYGLLPTTTVLLPTPQARDTYGQCHKSQKCLPNHFETSQLNPLFVAEMMCFPINWTVLPFLHGEEKVSKPTETQ